jgi:hypothetical protein
MRSKQSREQSFDRQQKLKAVLEAIGRPVSVIELSKNPILVSAGILNTILGANLRVLNRNKEVRKLPYRHWAPIKTRTSVTPTKTSTTPTSMFFVLIPSEQKVLLDVGGLRLPVVIE